MTSLRTVLLAEGDAKVRAKLAAAIRQEISCIVLEADSPADALRIMELEDVCLAILGCFPEPEAGSNLLLRALRDYAHIVPISCVPAGDRAAILKVLQYGAFSYVNHPYNVRETVIAAARGLAWYDLLVHKERKGPKIRKSDGFYGIIGASEKMFQLFDIIKRVAEDGESTILIQGESGTGKEMVARAIHAHSMRRNHNFVPVNCTAIPNDLLESELFGYLKGAFTGATQAKMGRLQFAEGGTLFLDEVGDMPQDLQAKLLRVLQEREFVPLGGLKPVPMDVRIIAATHRDLEQMVREKTFREDLFYRLSVIPVIVPPLRERREDIPVLVEKFIQVFNRNRRNRVHGLEEGAMKALTAHAWPGNVRELENLINRLVVLSSGGSITLENLPPQFRSSSGAPSAPLHPAPDRDLPAEISWGPDGIDFNAVVGRLEDGLIAEALARAGGNKKEAARLLGLHRSTLLGKLRKQGVKP